MPRTLAAHAKCMKRSESTITASGRTTIPPEIRRELGLIAGTRLDWQVLGDGKLLVSSVDRAAASILEGFDPKRRGSEAMAFAPVGREFGSPDYEGLTEQDWTGVQSKLSKLIRACGELPEFKEITLTAKEIDATANVQTALREFGHDVSFRVAAGIWKHYSDSYAASWMAGAETVESAKRTLVCYCKQLRT